MVLDLKNVLVTPEARAEFSFLMDLSQFTLYNQNPIVNPVLVEGCVTNHAGALVLEGEMTSTLQLCCDRCLTSFPQEKKVLLNSLVADHLEDEENEDIILLSGTCLDLQEVASVGFTLEMDTKTLCSEQCLGLCSGCGANLNEESCRCTAVKDSPFSVLAQLLED